MLQNAFQRQLSLFEQALLYLTIWAYRRTWFATNFSLRARWKLRLLALKIVSTVQQRDISVGYGIGIVHIYLYTRWDTRQKISTGNIISVFRPIKLLIYTARNCVVVVRLKCFINGIHASPPLLPFGLASPFPHNPCASLLLCIRIRPIFQRRWHYHPTDAFCRVGMSGEGRKGVCVSF